jgi:hypothetical protein
LCKDRTGKQKQCEEKRKYVSKVCEIFGCKYLKNEAENQKSSKAIFS